MPVLTPVPAFAFKLFPLSQIILVCVFIVFIVFYLLRCVALQKCIFAPNAFLQRNATNKKHPQKTEHKKQFIFVASFFLGKNREQE